MASGQRSRALLHATAVPVDVDIHARVWAAELNVAFVGDLDIVVFDIRRLGGFGSWRGEVTGLEPSGAVEREGGLAGSMVAF